MSTVDFRLAQEIEKILLLPRPTFKSPAEFSSYLAQGIEPVVEAREEVAYRLGAAGLPRKTRSSLLSKRSKSI